MDARGTIARSAQIVQRTGRFYAPSIAHFRGGQAGEILVKVFNDTLQSAPVEFEWTIESAGKRLAGEKQTLKIVPGTGQENTLRWTPPNVTKRQDATLILRVSQNGKVGFEDQKDVSDFSGFENAPQVLAAQNIALQNETGKPLLVWDRSGKLAPWLQARGMAFQSVANLDELKNKNGLLLIGPNTLTAEEAFGTGVLAFATRGNRAIVLEQKIPLSGRRPAATDTRDQCQRQFRVSRPRWAHRFSPVWKAAICRIGALPGPTFR